MTVLWCRMDAVGLWASSACGGVLLFLSGMVYVRVLWERWSVRGVCYCNPFVSIMLFCLLCVFERIGMCLGVVGHQVSVSSSG
jgi:hypothetical protein